MPIVKTEKGILRACLPKTTPLVMASGRSSGQGWKRPCLPKSLAREMELERRTAPDVKSRVSPGSPLAIFDPAAPALRAAGLTVRYPDAPAPALDDLTLEVAAGECVLLTGPSGCGKTTLARALNGLIPHAIPAQVTGRLEAGGVDVSRRTVSELARRVGSVFQNPAAQLFHLRVDEEAAFGARNLGLPGEIVQERVAWALETLGLAALRHRRPGELSYGQQQRLAIAATLVMQPQLLVLDEPTASLDLPGAQAVMAALHKLRAQYGIAIVLIEHRLAEAAQLADRTVILQDGRVAAAGPTRRVLNDPACLDLLGLEAPPEASPANWQDWLIATKPPPTPAPPLLALRGVSAGYGRSAVIHAVDLTIAPGEFIALVGDNGAGKTTLALTAAGLLRPLAGCVRFAEGRRPQPGRDIALLFQNPADQLFTGSVDEEVAFGPRNYGVFHPGYHHECLARTDLLALRTRRPLTLSTGQQQRVALAACLALRPRLLILDEPTLGQDWGHLRALLEMLTDLLARGTAIVLITHDLRLVRRCAQRVVWMQAGRIVMDGRIRSLYKPLL